MKALAVGRKEFRQIVRDRRSLAILLFVPAFFLLLYGYALNFDIRHISLAVLDRDRTSVSRELTSAFIQSGYFDQVADVVSYDEIERLMDENRIRAALIMPERMARDLQTERGAVAQVIVNGDNANTASTVFGYAQAIVRGVSVELQLRLAARGPCLAPVSVEPRIW